MNGSAGWKIETKFIKAYALCNNNHNRHHNVSGICFFFFSGKMNIPAFGSEFLRIGRTYDAANPAVAGIDIYPADIPTVKDNKNRFQFEYKVVKNSSDVNKLLDISGELSLKVKVGLVSVQGSGKYLTDSKKQEDTTELLAVLKCFTVSSPRRCKFANHLRCRMKQV